jgi:hydrogenase expression/formation protein HypC
MCIGVPLQVIEVELDGDFATCADGPLRERLDMRLIGAQPAGAWVLAFHGAARRVLDADEAARIRDALTALQGALDGSLEADPGAFDALFSDLVGREPVLPAHLRPPA